MTASASSRAQPVITDPSASDRRQKACPAGEHPLAVLRRALADSFDAGCLPPGVFPVSPWCREPQFFPGGSGMPMQDTWDELVPGSCGHLEALPPTDGRDILVLANYQATLASYAAVADGAVAKYQRTWRGLRHLLQTVPPRRTFLTNAYIGLADHSPSTRPFPAPRWFQEQCRDLLRLELRLLRPRVVVCLGRASAQMLTRAVTSGLGGWNPWPGYDRILDDAPRGWSCEFDGLRFVAVAVRHPSAVVAADERDIEALVIQRAVANH